MAIMCKSFERTPDEGDVRRCLLLADETPETMPTTGAGIDNLSDDVQLDGGSIMMCLDNGTTHVLGNDRHTWHTWA